MWPLLLASTVIAGAFGSPVATPAVPDPYHAFCRAVWLFGLPCADVGTKLVQQIQAFSPVKSCDKCHYTLVTASKTFIEARHTSPDNIHAERIEFSLQTTVLTGSCHVSAQSVSLSFTSLLDGGLNYCNLHDLLTGSGLLKAPGFMELTNEWACLGYGFATCKA